MGISEQVVMMKGVVFVLAVSLAVATAEESWRNYIKRGITDCASRGSECQLGRSCCGTDQCYYEDGKNAWNPIQKGVCVQCVEVNLTCQLDRNCCAKSTGILRQCDKTGDHQTNGVCKARRGLGEECWEESQCASGNCNDGWFSSGVCV